MAQTHMGLVSLSLSKRTKEIGIRKVLGASVTDILFLVGREYFWLMVTAFVAAAPLTYLVAGRWLESFAYRIELNWWMFGLPGGLLLFFAMIIVVVQLYGRAMAELWRH